MPERTTSGDATDDGTSIAAYFQPFLTRPVWVHVIVLLVGVGVWFAVYVFAIEVVGSRAVVTEASVRGVLARQRFAILATVACALYFAVAMTRGLGGLLLNVFAPAVTVGLVSAIDHPLFGSRSSSVPTPSTAIDDVQYLLLGVIPWLVTFSAVAIWFTYLNRKGELDDWAEKHLPTTLRGWVET